MLPPRPQGALSNDLITDIIEVDDVLDDDPSRWGCFACAYLPTSLSEGIPDATSTARSTYPKCVRRHWNSNGMRLESAVPPPVRPSCSGTFAY